MGAKRTGAVVLLVLVLWVLVLAACRQGTALPLGREAYRNGPRGYSIRYPQGWQYLERGGTVQFYQDEEALKDSSTAAGVLVIAGTPAELGVIGGAVDSRGVLESIDLGTGQGEDQLRISRVWDLSLSGQKAAAVDITGTQSGVEVGGRYVAIHLGTRIVVLAGAGSREAWKKFLPTFEAMVASVSFFSPE